MLTNRISELLDIAVDLGVSEDDILNLIYKRCEEIHAEKTNVRSLKVAFCTKRLQVLGAKNQNGKILNFCQNISKLK